MPRAKSNGTGGRAGPAGLRGWDRLRHGGLLLDGARLDALAGRAPAPLDAWTEGQLRQRAGAMLDGGADAAPFVAFVLEQVCGFDASTGAWTRGSHVAPAWGRRAVTGETVKPRQLWQGRRGARLPVFLDDGRQLGIGRSRRAVSRVLGWLRAGGDHLALVTNGRQWRLVFAGLDHDAWCEWDIELWFEDGGPSPQVTALRTLLQAPLWTPETEGAGPPLLQAVRDTRKGQAELSEVLGERVREAVEILIRAHGEDLTSLGETDDVREYVERLADDAGAPAPDADEVREMFGAGPAEIYRAACRVAMRLVVILFAESRDLLPRDNPLYHESYGLHGLLERLERTAARGRNLAGGFGAWPRVLALFALVREGSHHPELPVTAYGGDLFAPGTVEADDGVSRALRVYEHACFEREVMPDRDVHEMLQLLTRTTIRIRQGRSSIRAAAPVDFSDLSSEYIGILYEGLLDYELKTAPAGDPVVFLSVGDQPALPLSRLEAMDDRALRTLFEKLKEKSGGTDDLPEGEAAGGDKAGGTDDLPEDEAAGGDTADVEDDTADAVTSAEELLSSDSGDASPPEGVPPDAPPSTEVPPSAEAAPSANGMPASPAVAAAAPDERRRNRTRAEQWARRAVQAARLLPKPRGRDTPERRLAFEGRLAAKARQLVARVVLPGEWYLVRWGGTRKGSGSFYTRPGLAVPTVQRTLRPLAYDPPAGADGQPDPDAPPARWTPKPPERILDLTVCDPACGSGTFPLAALRFLTDALYAALQHHDRLQPDGDRVLVRLLGIRGATDGDSRLARPSSPDGSARRSTDPTDVRPVSRPELLADELIPCRPDDDSFEPRLKAVLRRHVVERCIYAVDLDPLAVELCRLSLWIETLDRTLPFGFLDHKIKCGNALVGAWFDQFAHYPAMAWKNREGGDKNHSNGVHFEQNARTKAIKAFVKGKLTPDLRQFLRGADLFQPDLLAQSAKAHEDALAVLERMHAMPVHDAAERARLYRDELVGSDAWRSLKEAMDLWCACWFWPVDDIDDAPLPSTFADPPEATRAVARRVAAGMRFFHWELEFPDVFRQAGSGFDAMLGNPPWDIAKPVSKEFFSNLDPLYRSYGKQEALDKQSQYFADAAVERDWLDYGARFRAQSNFMSHAASPFGDPDENAAGQDRFTIARGGKGLELHERWRAARARSTGFADAAHPFRHQGSADINLYKLFLESAHALLRPLGALGALGSLGPGVTNVADADASGAAPRGEGTAGSGTRGIGDARPRRHARDQDAAGTDTRGGRLGFLVPSGLYSDHGTGALRNLFLESCRWEWLFGVENRDKIFPIESRFKFNSVVIEKAGTTEAIRTVFMRRNPDDWERAEELAIPYSLAQIKQFSPKSRALLEIQSQRDLDILEKIYANAVLLGDDGPDGWGIRYTREFDMTGDSKLFPPRPQWEAKDYRPDEYSRWLLGDWQPVKALWEEMEVDPSRPEPAEIELEDRPFDTSAGPDARPTGDERRGPALTVAETRDAVVAGRPTDDERRSPSLTVTEAGGGVGSGRATDDERPGPSVAAAAARPRGEQRARFVPGHRLKPGDIARTDWHLRCAQPPYDRLPVPRAALPPGVVLSRDGTAWLAEKDIAGVALPLYQGIMIQPFLPSARGWLGGTGLRAKWDYSDLGDLQWNPQYLMATEDAISRDRMAAGLKIGFRDISRDSDARCFMGALLPHFPCGHSAPVLSPDPQAAHGALLAEPLSTLLNSFVFDWQIRQRGGGAHLSWYMLANIALPATADSAAMAALVDTAARLNLHHPVFAAEAVLTANDGVSVGALREAERSRLRATADAIAAALYSLGEAELAHILQDVDLDASTLRDRSSALDVRGFWRIDRDKPPELRHTVLALVAFHDLQAKINAADGDRERGIEAFLTQNDGEGWMLPETLRLADYGLGHDERAREPQPVASRLGPRFYDWQLVQSADESWRECHLHARNLLGEHGYALRVADLIAQRMTDGEDYRGLLTDRFTHDLTGDDGYVTVLAEIRARDLFYESAWWSLVDELRGTGQLDDDNFGRLLDRLHARDLLSDADYRRRSGRAPPATGTDLPLQRVAETAPGDQPELFPTRRQRKLFE